MHGSQITKATHFDQLARSTQLLAREECRANLVEGLEDGGAVLARVHRDVAVEQRPQLRGLGHPLRRDHLGDGPPELLPRVVRPPVLREQHDACPPGGRRLLPDDALLVAAAAAAAVGPRPREAAAPMPLGGELIRLAARSRRPTAGLGGCGVDHGLQPRLDHPVREPGQAARLRRRRQGKRLRRRVGGRARRRRRRHAEPGRAAAQRAALAATLAVPRRRPPRHGVALAASADLIVLLLAPAREKLHG